MQATKMRRHSAGMKWLPPQLIMPNRFVTERPAAATKASSPSEAPKRSVTASSNATPAAPKRSSKPARKTAHRIIEKRRRARMNGELGILEGKLPVSLNGAFKVDIIQAANAYIDHLEDCVARLELKVQNQTQQLPSVGQLLGHAGESSMHQKPTRQRPQQMRSTRPEST